MGYGFGGFLIVVGLVLALAVQDSVDAVDLTMVGWIMAGVGVVVIGLAIATNFDRGRARTTTTTTHSDGTQSVRDTRTDVG
ncbi:hypothetical protein GCM10023340_38510 [Nocardioides marinquilinus]|uniref:DUF6458 domain-containing protein n=1 Tax=Nocardioides marinquilinus TaxID=1210400 RepID=A0ABP9Q0C9_9ACTN